MTAQEDIDKVDTIVYTPEESDDEPFNMAINDTSEDPTIVMGKPVTTAFISADIHIPTEKVDCLQVTSQLKEFLKHFPPQDITSFICILNNIYTACHLLVNMYC